MCEPIPGDPPIKPPNKKVAEYMTELTFKMSKCYDPTSRDEIINVNKFNFINHEIAELKAINEMLWHEIKKLKELIKLDER